MAQQNMKLPPNDEEGPQGELPEIDPGTLAAEPEIPISLVDETEVTTHNVKAIGTRSVIGAAKEQFKRQPTMTGEGAVRCRIFHSRIAAAPLSYMEQQINEWLDNSQIEVKAVSQVIGVMEGKTPEPNVIVTIWY